MVRSSGSFSKTDTKYLCVDRKIQTEFDVFSERPSLGKIRKELTFCQRDFAGNVDCFIFRVSTN